VRPLLGWGMAAFQRRGGGGGGVGYGQILQVHTDLIKKESPEKEEESG